MLKGIDVARYEPIIDWKKVQEQDYKFAFIKCSQALFNDLRFYEHWNNAKSEGMPRGAYHFYDPRYQTAKPERQAEYFFNSLKGDLGELPFVIDIELYITGYYVGSHYWYNYIERLNQLSGNHPLMIYTAYYFWMENIRKPVAVSDVNYFGKYPLWVANYGVVSPLIPRPWTNWLFWQYGETATIDGITDELGRLTKCDTNFFNGTEEQFKEMFNIGGTVTPPPTGEPMSFKITPDRSIGSKIRVDHNISSTQLGSLAFGRFGYGVLRWANGTAEDWLHITEYENAQGVRVALDGWIAAKSGGVQIATIVEILDVPPPSPTEPTLTHTIEVFSDGNITIDGNPYP